VWPPWASIIAWQYFFVILINSCICSFVISIRFSLCWQRSILQLLRRDEVVKREMNQMLWHASRRPSSSISILAPSRRSSAIQATKIQHLAQTNIEVERDGFGSKCWIAWPCFLCCRKQANPETTKAFASHFVRWLHTLSHFLSQRTAWFQARYVIMWLSALLASYVV
jgi:hypothetical protein